MKRSKCETVQSEEVTRFLMAISVKLECWGCGLIWSSTLLLPANSDSLGGGVTLLSAREEEQFGNGAGCTAWHGMTDHQEYQYPVLASSLVLECPLPRLHKMEVFLLSSYVDALEVHVY